LALLPVAMAITGCTSDAPPSTGYSINPPAALPAMPAAPSAPAGGRTTGAVALLVPLTGDLAPVGQALANAAKLAFADTSGPALDIRDTTGTPAGAAAAAQAAIAAGDGLILGPLTSAEAHAVAPLAQAGDVNVLAFTNDSSVAAPGIWTLGITPEEQVARVVATAAAAGRTQLAALLPDSDFGHSLATALQGETATLGDASPSITFYQDGFNNLNQAVRDLSDYQNRGAGLDAQIKAAKDQDTPAGRAKARALAHQPVPPPAFNALFIGATTGEPLAEIATFLPFYAVAAPQVQLLGPALWANIAPAMGSNAAYVGALYAAPDPAAAAAFDAKYQSVYGSAPPAIADVAFDAAAIAHLAAGQGGYTSTVLTAPAGFSGTDGVLQLAPNGQVQRGLAVFQIAPGAPTIASPAPASIAAPNRLPAPSS
jgi:ABC-type branched-subunit amino acid transport system substrate-binding protein